MKIGLYRNSRATVFVILCGGLLLFAALVLLWIVPTFVVIGLFSLIGVLVLLALMVVSRKLWWEIWLLVCSIAAFGPFLDIVTDKPISWLVGMLVLVMFLIMILRLLSVNQNATETVRRRHPIPVLGMGFGIYLAYLFLQTLRPDVENVNALLSLRAPLIGFAAYCLTIYSVRHYNRTELETRLCQFFLVFMILGIIVSLYGLIQYALGPTQLQNLGLLDPAGNAFHNQRNLNGGTTIFRIYSTLRRNEVLGTFLYLNIIISTVAIFFRVQPRWLIYLSIIVSAIVMLLALSLTSIALLFIWLLLVVLISKSKRLVIGTVMLGLLSCLVIIGMNFVLNGLIVVRLQEHFLDAEEGVGRLEMFLNWVTEMSHRSVPQLFFGTGVCTGLDADTLGRVAELLRQLGIQVGQIFACGWRLEIHDNWFATQSLEIGVVGLILFWLIFLLLLLEVLPRLGKRWKATLRSGWIMLAMGILAFWFSGFVGALILYMPITIYFWSLVGFLDLGAGVSPTPKTV